MNLRANLVRAIRFLGLTAVIEIKSAPDRIRCTKKYLSYAAIMPIRSKGLALIAPLSAHNMSSLGVCIKLYFYLTIDSLVCQAIYLGTVLDLNSIKMEFKSRTVPC